MMTARNFQAAMQMLRQLEFALFDFRLHQEFDPASQDQIPALLAQVRSQVAVMTPPRSTASSTASPTSSPAAMRRATTATSGPRCSPPTPSPASRRRDLQPGHRPVLPEAHSREGGSKEPMELFRAFRGREPRWMPCCATAASRPEWPSACRTGQGRRALLPADPVSFKQVHICGIVGSNVIFERKRDLWSLFPRLLISCRVHVCTVPASSVESGSTLPGEKEPCHEASTRVLSIKSSPACLIEWSGIFRYLCE